MSFTNTREWNASWISFVQKMYDWRVPVLPAPYFRREFEVTNNRNLKLYICGIGYHEIYCNGKKVGDYELVPTPTKYDAHAAYLVYEISKYLIQEPILLKLAL